MLELDEPGQPVFVDVGLNGVSERVMKDGHCIFSGIKFKTTSFNHDDSLFFLVITVYSNVSVSETNSEL